MRILVTPSDESLKTALVGLKMVHPDVGKLAVGAPVVLWFNWNPPPLPAAPLGPDGPLGPLAPAGPLGPLGPLGPVIVTPA